MPMMDVREVVVRVYQRLVHMTVRVWLAAVPLEVMRVLMVYIMRMHVRVLVPLVPMRMSMPFRNVEPNTATHQ